MNIHTDGTLTTTDADQFGGGESPMQSALYGAWEQTGHRQARFSGLLLFFDPDGTHAATGRISGPIIFDAAFQQFTIENAVVEVFEPGQNPTDPNEQPSHTSVELLVLRPARPLHQSVPMVALHSRLTQRAGESPFAFCCLSVC